MLELNAFNLGFQFAFLIVALVDRSRSGIVFSGGMVLLQSIWITHLLSR